MNHQSLVDVVYQESRANGYRISRADLSVLLRIYRVKLLAQLGISDPEVIPRAGWGR